MTNWERINKRTLRTIRTIPVDAVAEGIAKEESQGHGMWCLVAGDAEFVSADGQRWVTMWSDGPDQTMYERWLLTRPERIHENHESAVEFVRRELAAPRPKPS